MSNYIARNMSGRPNKFKLAHEFLWGHTAMMMMFIIIIIIIEPWKAEVGPPSGPT